MSVCINTYRGGGKRRQKNQTLIDKTIRKEHCKRQRGGFWDMSILLLTKEGESYLKNQRLQRGIGLLILPFVSGALWDDTYIKKSKAKFKMTDVFWKCKFCKSLHMISRRKYETANKTYLKCKHCRKWNQVQKTKQQLIKHSKE